MAFSINILAMPYELMLKVLDHIEVSADGRADAILLPGQELRQMCDRGSKPPILIAVLLSGLAAFLRSVGEDPNYSKK